MNKLKGVGSATLDRGISIVIGAVVLGGVVAGVNWLYNTQKRNAFIEDLNTLSMGLRSYYGIYYHNINVERVVKAKILPDGYDPNYVGDVKLKTLPTSILIHGDRMVKIPTSMPYGWSLSIEFIPYDLCMILGTANVAGLKYIYGSNTVSHYYVGNFPINNVEKQEEFEQFCSDNADERYVSLVFQ